MILLFEQLFWRLRCFFVIEMMNRKGLVLLLGLIFLSCERLLGQTVGMNVGQRPSEGMVIAPVVVGKVVDSTTRKALNSMVAGRGEILWKKI